MRYPVLTADKAREILEASRRGEAIDDSSRQFRGRGQDLDLQVIDNLARQLDKIKRKYPEMLRRRDPRGGSFEAEACEILHRALPIATEMLADYDFWTWLAVCQFRELVDWRHGGEEGHAVPENFGIGKRDENLLYRMWLRADIGCDSLRDDAYNLARRGDQDFWRSHVLRQGYGRCRAMVRALIRYQFPDASEGSPTLRILAVRELAKRLKRLHANLLFEFLDEESARRLLEREAEAAKLMVAHRSE